MRFDGSGMYRKPVKPKGYSGSSNLVFHLGPGNDQMQGFEDFFP
jgi:hypothetical protein